MYKPSLKFHCKIIKRVQSCQKISFIYIFLILTVIAVSCSSDKEPSATPESEQVISDKFITPKEAGDIAAVFLASLGNEKVKTRGISPFNKRHVELLQDKNLTRTSETDTTFYVVNFDGGGYAIVAADRDLDNKIYVYSTTDNFNGIDNPVLDIYLENAVITMPEAPRRSNMGNSSTGISRKPTYPSTTPDIPSGEEYINGQWYVYYMYGSHQIKEPLLTTAWHQYKPYNMYCPTKNGTNCYVGCVAVAMGQICSYFRWPEQLNDNVYDWDSMLTIGRHSNPIDIGVDDIAHLLRDIGSLVDMNYGTSGSSSSIDKAVSGFKKMGYTSVQKKNFIIGEIITSLSNNRPLYMKGKKSSDGKGHAWVIDGHDSLTSRTEYYNKETGELYAIYTGVSYCYLHFNAGWEETNWNTYYLCSGGGVTGHEDKDFSTFGFSNDNQIITNITK